MSNSIPGGFQTFRARLAWRLIWNASEGRYMLRPVSIKEQERMAENGDNSRLYFTRKDGCRAVREATAIRARMMN